MEIKTTTLYLGPEENLSILRQIYSSQNKSPEKLAEKSGKNKGTILNSIHDLRILGLIDEQSNHLDKARNIIYKRNELETLKELFLNIPGYSDAVNEIIKEEKTGALEIGRIFCFYSHAKAIKENSIKQIGRLYTRWLKYLKLINQEENE